jgi:predicted nucleic acid-binding protein
VRAAQNHLLNAVAAGGIQVMDLLPEDDARIAELNDRYADLPGDFVNLAIVALADLLKRAAQSCYEPSTRQRFQC